MLCETGYGFNSKNYVKYKPYQPPQQGYNWKDYVKLNKEGDEVISCHMCDIRQTGCTSTSHPRYYCKKDRRSIQTTLTKWMI